MDDRDQPNASDSAELFRRLAAGDEQAQTEVFERYMERLTWLARTRLAAKLAARVDPEDIVMSAYRSFFVAVRKGRFEIEQGGDLWRLLVEVTLHKLYRTVQHHTAQQRALTRELNASDGVEAFALAAGNEPTPDEALAAAEELEAVLRELTDRDRQALELRLQGYELEEIADRLHCNERTVRRAIGQARRLMATRGGHNFVPSAARRRPKSMPRQSREKQGPSIADVAVPYSWNDFVLREQIGAGATGRVYRATRKADGREFAIKFLRKSLTTSAAAIERFLQEARTVAALSHAGIVAMHGAGKTPGGGLFLVMDLVRGLDLDRVRRKQLVSTDDAVRWLGQAASTLHFAHEQGVIHCDLKPSNLLLDAYGSVRVSDFGLAVRLSESANRLPAVVGTPAYMAPEQVDPCWGSVSPRTDVWGLGGVLYFLLFGRPPHAGTDVPSTLANVVSKCPVSLQVEGAPGVPQELLKIVAQCLAKNPAERIDSARELAAVLSAVMPAR